MVVIGNINAGVARADAGSEMARQDGMGHANFCDDVLDALGDHQARAFPRGVLVLIAVALRAPIADREPWVHPASIFAVACARAGGEILRGKFHPGIGDQPADVMHSPRVAKAKNRTLERYRPVLAFLMEKVRSGDEAWAAEGRTMGYRNEAEHLGLYAIGLLDRGGNTIANRERQIEFLNRLAMMAGGEQHS